MRELTYFVPDGPAVFDGPYGTRSFRRERSTPYDSGVVVNEYRRTRS
jgi:hypothetical protein